MTYEKPVGEVIEFDNDALFMTTSWTHQSIMDTINTMCSSFHGNTNSFKCPDFNPDALGISGFEKHGNGHSENWYCSKFD